MRFIYSSCKLTDFFLLYIIIKFLFIKKPKIYKLFINFFEWNRIPAPKTDEDPIPVYGHKIEEMKNSESVVNIAFNNEILKKYGKNAENGEERDMLINLAFQYIQEQNSVSIDLISFKLLNDTICFGNAEKNTSMLTKEYGKKVPSKAEFNAANEAIKAMESNQVPDEETILNNLLKLNINPNAKKCQSSFEENKNHAPLIEDLNPSFEVPKFTVEVIEKNVEDIILQIKIHLSMVSSISECDLSIDNKKIHLIANKAFYKPLEISLHEYENKYKLNLDDLDAKFIKKSCMLKLKINAKKV